MDARMCKIFLQGKKIDARQYFMENKSSS